MNSAFNLLGSSPLLKPHFFKQSLLPLIEEFLELLGGGDNKQRPRRILLVFPCILKPCAFQEGLDFWKEEKAAWGRDLGNVVFVGPWECCVWPKTATQVALNGVGALS